MQFDFEPLSTRQLRMDQHFSLLEVRPAVGLALERRVPPEPFLAVYLEVVVAQVVSLMPQTSLRLPDPPLFAKTSFHLTISEDTSMLRSQSP